MTRVYIHETYAYLDVLGYDVDSFPEGWREMTEQQKADWVRDRYEPSEYHSEPLEPMEVTRVEEIL